MGGHRAGGRAVVYRTAAVVQAFALTAAVTWWAWVATSLVVGAGAVDDAPFLRRTDHWWVALTLAVLAMAGLVLVATYSAAGFERYRRPNWASRPAPSASPWGADAFGDLSDVGFYDNGRAHARRWLVHVLAAVVAASGAIAWAATASGGVADPTRELGWLVLAATGVVVLCAAAMSLVPAARTDDRLAWRHIGAVTAIGATVLAGGLVLSACLWQVPIASLPRGPLVLAYSAYGWAVGALAVALACAAVVRLRTPSAGEEIREPERPLPTLSGRIVGRVAPVLVHTYVALAAFSVTFVVALGIGLVANRHDLEGYRLTDTPPVGLARWTFALLLGFLFVNLVKSRADPAVLRRVGTIWDVFTFWPRTFHPFSVRCYAERAVPELQELLDDPEQSPTVVLAHSQGSVLTYAALSPLIADAPADGDAPRAGPWGLVTVGCPLRSLYARAFPSYFAPPDFLLARQRLGDRWWNLFRYTDYIGRGVFAPDGDAVAGDGPRPAAPDCWLPTPRSRTSRLELHSNYWDDPWVVARVQDTLADTITGTITGTTTGATTGPGPEEQA
jgi:hypothetical protein